MCESVRGKRSIEEDEEAGRSWEELDRCGLGVCVKRICVSRICVGSWDFGGCAVCKTVGARGGEEVVREEAAWAVAARRRMEV